MWIAPERLFGALWYFGEQPINGVAEPCGGALDRSVKPDEFGDLGRMAREGQAKFRKAEPHIARDEAVEIEGQIIVCGIGNDPEDEAGNPVGRGDLANRFGFHFNGIVSGRLPQQSFL